MAVHIFSLLLPHSVGGVLIFCLALPILYILSRATYNIFFHPLHSFPGPISYAASRIPYCRMIIQGTLPFELLSLHEKYGEVVRIAPDELSFSHPDAWKDIMGHLKSGQEMSKYQKFYRPVGSEATHIVDADREEHSRLRRQLAHGFSDKSMRDQEPLIGQYVDLLIKRLHENCGDGTRPVNMAAWYNFTTFDVIGDLAFGEPFGCLENSSYHPWIKMIFEGARVGTWFVSMAHFPMIQKMLIKLVPKRTKERRRARTKMAEDMLRRRMERGEERPDLIEGLLKKKDEWNLSFGKLQANGRILILGGSETTATLLAGITYLLLTNPDALAKLTEEVRSSFDTEDEININSASRLKYMLACLDETLRVYPPVPAGLPRVVPRGGGSILGRYVPENTVVAIPQWASYHNPNYFTDPFNYHPERFLGDERFAADKRDIFQPFHIGPRNCLGRNLAYAEMRIILARVIFNFDMKIAPDSSNWMPKQKVYFFWEKGPLNVYLTPAFRN